MRSRLIARSSAFRTAVKGETDFTSIKSQLEAFVRNNQNAPSVLAYKAERDALSSSFGRLAVSDSVADPVEEIYNVNQRIGRLDDAFLGVRGIAGSVSGTIDSIPNLTSNQILELRGILQRGFPGRIDYGPLPSRILPERPRP